MLILADSNEQGTSPQTIENMREVFPQLQTISLVFGDYNVIMDNGDILAIERKEASDFLASIGDGRLFRQVEEMANEAKWYCVVQVGSISFRQGLAYVNGEETNWKESSVQGAKWAIGWSGCPIIETTSKNFPYTVANIINFCSKPDIHWQGLGHKRIVTFPPIDLPTEILSAFPGVGLKRAKSAMQFAKEENEDVPSLAQTMAWITAFPLIDYDSRPSGWGDKTVQNFRATLGLAPYEYLDIKEEEQQKPNNKKKGSKK